MSKVEFIRRLKSGLRFKLSRKRIKEIVAEYEIYFDNNNTADEEDIVEQCGDVKLIIAEHLGADATPYLSVRIVLLETVYPTV